MTTAPQPSDAARIGVVGAGQLARMMGEAARGAGVSLTVLSTSAGEPAVATCDGVVRYQRLGKDRRKVSVIPS